MRWPKLEGQRVWLATVDLQEEQWLYEVGGLTDLANRWRNPPGTIGRQQFHDQLWVGVLAQFVVKHRETSERLGHVMAYQPNLAHGTASVAIMIAPGAQRLGWPLEGFLLFVDYVFSSFNLRKLYAEAADYNFDQYRSALGKFMREEGCLRSHIYAAGSYHDVRVLAIYRSEWEDYAARFRD